MHPIDNPKVMTASEITDEIERAAAFHQPFDPSVNQRLASLEQTTDAQMHEFDGEIKDKNMSMQFDMSDPRVRKLIQRVLKEQKARAPKHENFPSCHKYCPRFKANQCFSLDAATQKQCWDANWDEKVRKVPDLDITGVPMKKLAKDFTRITVTTPTDK